jgi:protein-disulfide isomerase
MADSKPDQSSSSAPPRHSLWPVIRGVLDVVATVAMILVAAVVLWGALRSPGARGLNVQVPSRPLPVEGAAVLGSSTAPVVLLGFSDFECPYCATFANEVLPVIKEKYIEDGAVQFVFRHLPLPMHTRALAAARAVECAGRQDRFWPMHDRLFGRPMLLSDQEFMRHGDALRLEMVQFQSCLASDEPAAERIDDDLRLARELGVSATPTFFAGLSDDNGFMTAHEVLSGARPASHFEEVIQRLLDRGRRSGS